MFERFTGPARRVVVLAQEEARRLDHNYIGTEHILLGVVREDDSVGAKALESLGIALEDVRSQVEEIIGRGGPHRPVGHIAFTPRAKAVLELSLREALQLGHNYIGTEHIVLGLIREGEGVGAQVLAKLGAEPSGVRERVLVLLSGRTPPPMQAAMRRPSVEMRPSRIECSFCGRDVWDVEHFVAGDRVLICEQCLLLGRTVVEAARQAGTAVGQPLFLPPRVSGDIPSPDATGAIVEAFGAVFAGGGDRERAAAHLEGGERLAAILDEAASRHPQFRGTRLRIDRVRYLDASTAQVRFTIIPAGVGGFAFEGGAVERDSRWLVSRDTFCEVMARGGVACPPLDG